jgi:hypothetical protein
MQPREELLFQEGKVYLSNGPDLTPIENVWDGRKSSSFGELADCFLPNECKVAV